VKSWSGMLREDVFVMAFCGEAGINVIVIPKGTPH
jgi:hypothetical protein